MVIEWERQLNHSQLKTSYVFWKMRKSTNKNNQLKLPEVYKKNRQQHLSQKLKFKMSLNTDYGTETQRRDGRDMWKQLIQLLKSY